MLVIVLVRSVNYGRSGNRETSKEKYLQSGAETLRKIINQVKTNKEQKTLMSALVQSVSAKNSVLEGRLNARLSFHGIRIKFS